jgi:DNA-binding GntR family transcriptional regulator
VAEALKVSESPVREALRLLATEGFVQLTPHVGAVVTEILDEGLEEVLFMRAALEGIAARLAAARVTPQDLRDLVDLVEEMEVVRRRTALEEYMRLNRKFHRRIYGTIGRPRLQKTIEDLWVQSERSQASFRTPQSAARSNREHRAIVAALSRRDGKEAERLTREQIFNTVDMLQAAVRARGSRSEARPNGSGPTVRQLHGTLRGKR